MSEANARSEEQLGRMKKLKESGLCLFCGTNYAHVGASPPVHETIYWYVKKNDHPYDGVVHHYLLVPKSHAIRLTQLEAEEFADFQTALRWLEEVVQAPGYSLFVRQGAFEYTGATFDHAHVQYISGGPKPADWTLENAGEKCLPITLGFKRE